MSKTLKEIQEDADFETRLLEKVGSAVEQRFNKLVEEAKKEVEAQQGESDGEAPGKRQGAKNIERVLNVNDHIQFYESDKMLLRMSRLFPNHILMVVNVKTMQSAMNPSDKRDPDMVTINSFLEAMIALKGLGKTEKTQDLAVVVRSLMDDSRDSHKADGV